MLTACKALFLFAVLTASTGALARSNSEVETELLKITEQIRTLDRKNTEQLGTLGKLESQLETLERDIADAVKSRQDLQKESQQEKTKLESITKRQARAEKSLHRHQQLLGSHTRALHRLSRRPGYELLSPDSIVTSNRQYQWHSYFQQARDEAITALEFEQASLNRLAAERTLTMDRLAALETGINSRTESLKTKREQRKKTAAGISKQLKATRQEITQLEENQSKLNKVLKKLQETLADPAFSIQGKTAFSKLRGQLPWPVKKSISSRKDGGGLQIMVSGNQSVRAISHGRVVYADWLRGFGLITIIDHGEGYMSLYGHNESLFKQVGDWVEPGEVIGNTGNHGGRSQTGLYFEIRHNSDTLSVKKWCKNTG